MSRNVQVGNDATVDGAKCWSSRLELVDVVDGGVHLSAVGG